MCFYTSLPLLGAFLLAASGCRTSAQAVSASDVETVDCEEIPGASYRFDEALAALDHTAQDSTSLASLSGEYEWGTGFMWGRYRLNSDSTFEGIEFTDSGKTYEERGRWAVTREGAALLVHIGECWIARSYTAVSVDGWTALSAGADVTVADLFPDGRPTMGGRKSQLYRRDV